MKKAVFLFIVIFCFSMTSLISQTQIRIAVFPFYNMDGNMKWNIWCYQLQDSLSTAMHNQDPGSESYYIVPKDSVELLLAELNVDPGNPQYETDMWSVAKKLNVKKVICGNFKYQAERFLINAYIWDVKTKLANPKFKARDIFKKEENLYEAVPEITESLVPAFKSSN